MILIYNVVLFYLYFLRIEANMRRKITILSLSCAICFLAGCRSKNASPVDTLDNKGVIIEEMQDENNEAVSDTTQAEPDVNETSVEIDASRIIEDQSFETQLNGWGDVRFVSCSPDDNISPLADVTFYLMEGDSVIYKMPSVYENDIRESGLVDGISFVAFKDINDDEKVEVIVGILYETGAGPQGVIPRTEVRIFEDNGDSFSYSKDLSEYVTGRIPDDGTIHDVYRNVTTYNLCNLDMEALYKEIKKIDNAKDFEGEWNATNCRTSVTASFSITDQNEYGFSFYGECYYYTHDGEISGKAYWVSDSMAICCQDDLDDTMSDGYMIFVLDGDHMYVRSDYGLGLMGMNVSPDHDYTRGEPVYINDNIAAETYTEDELSAIKELIGSDQYDFPFWYGTTDGCVTSSAKELYDGTECKYIECTIPTTAESYTAIITEDGRIYIMIYSYDTKSLYTNDPNWSSDELPEAIEG